MQMFFFAPPQLYAIYMAHHHKLNHMLIYFAHDVLEKLDDEYPLKLV